MRYRVDSMSFRDGVLMLEGWCIPAGSGKIEYSVVDRQGNELKCTAVARDRVDVAQQFGADRMSGFTVAVPFERDTDAYLVMRDGKAVRRVHVNNAIIEKRNSIKAKRWEKLMALVHFETLVVSWDFIRENGFRAFWKKAVHKIAKIDEDYDYAEWQFKTALSDEEINAQKEEWQKLPLEHFPLISIVVPAYNTPAKYLAMLLDSFEAQTYPNFEAVIADGSEPGYTEVADTMAKYIARDPKRFKLVSLGGNLGISGNTNAGLKAATGDYIALCDHDDELPPWALFEVVKAIAANPRAMFIYTDEDKIDFDGRALFEPHFKSDYNPELLCSVNYICHLSVIRRDLLEEVGGFREEFDGAQDHDFFFRCTEAAAARDADVNAAMEALHAGKCAAVAESDSLNNENAAAATASADCTAWQDIGINAASAAIDSDCCKFNKDSAAVGSTGAEDNRLSAKALTELKEGRYVSETIVHIPVICYHWRYHKGSTASDPKAKLYAFEAGKRAVAAHYERMGISFETIEKGVTFGFYHTIFKKPDETAPLVSIIIPNKDHTDDLEKVISSVTERSEYRRLEFIIVENNSTDEKTFDYYKELEARSGAIDGINIKVVYWKREFNYSAINNFGVGYAGGDYLLFLNNDVELLGADSITRMVNYVQRPEVGAVGARLTYGDDTIQHAGVIVGLGGIAGAAFTGLHEKENSYMHRMMCVQELSAVTAACVMLRRDVFEAAGGFREELAVAFNDIDLCMKVRALGKLVIYDPYVTFHHYESKSRGLEDTPEKVQRFNNEIAIFAHYWGGILEHGDPYYNPNLTLRKSNFALRNLMLEKPGEPYKLELDVEKQLKTVLREKERRGLAKG